MNGESALHCIYQFHLQQGRAVCSTVLLSEVVVVGLELGAQELMVVEVAGLVHVQGCMKGCRAEGLWCPPGPSLLLPSSPFFSTEFLCT